MDGGYHRSEGSRFKAGAVRRGGAGGDPVGYLTMLSAAAPAGPAESMETRRFAAGLGMELGGLEPPTSWVRSTIASPRILPVSPVSMRDTGSRTIVVNRLI